MNSGVALRKGLQSVTLRHNIPGEGFGVSDPKKVLHNRGFAEMDDQWICRKLSYQPSCRNLSISGFAEVFQSLLKGLELFISWKCPMTMASQRSHAISVIVMTVGWNDSFPKSI